MSSSSNPTLSPPPPPPPPPPPLLPPGSSSTATSSDTPHLSTSPSVTFPRRTSLSRPGVTPTSTNLLGHVSHLEPNTRYPPSSSATQFQDEEAGSSSSAVLFPTTRPGRQSFGAGDEDIEMEPVMGHRRRKSSLMIPANQNPLRLHGQSRGLTDEQQIAEDSNHGVTEGRESFSDEDLHDDEETGLTTNDKSRRQKKRRRNTLLDQRIAREKHTAPGGQTTAGESIAKRLTINALLIGLWYLFSLSISLYNKWMFDEDRLNFAFPLFTTSMHMLVQFGLSVVVLYLVPSLRPHHTSDKGRSRHETEPAGKGMTAMFYLTRIGPCGASTGLDIGLGNTSLKFISLTFYTMCKSSSLAFVLTFAFLFRLETPTWRLVAIIATMILGVILMVSGEVEFHLGGFFLVISAAFFSGFRWGLTQILLLRNPATSNPFSSIFYLTPVMFLSLFALAIPVEGFGPLIEGLKTLSGEWGVAMTPLFLLFPGCIAFAMTASEFALLQRTSVVTLSIAGIFKEVVTISAASIAFDDKLTPINIVGLVTTLAAILAYNYIKISKMREEARAGTDKPDGHDPMLNSPAGSGSDSDREDGEEETAGLLQTNIENSQTLVTSDGDLQPNLLPHSPVSREDKDRLSQ